MTRLTTPSQRSKGKSNKLDHKRPALCICCQSATPPESWSHFVTKLSHTSLSILLFKSCFCVSVLGRENMNLGFYWPCLGCRFLSLLACVPKKKRMNKRQILFPSFLSVLCTIWFQQELLSSDSVLSSF